MTASSAKAGPQAVRGAAIALLARATAAGVVATLIVAACGGDVSGGGTGGAAGAGGAGGGTGGGAAHAGAGGQQDGGGASGASGASGAGGAGGLDWGECSTPDNAFCGYAQCTACPGALPCFSDTVDGGRTYGLCAYLGDWELPEYLMNAPEDGRIIYDVYPLKAASSHWLWGFTVSLPFSAGLYLEAHDKSQYVTYADRGKWTGAPLPEAKECPEVAGLDLCGGNCGGCPAGELCTGRSPLHPWGFCVPESVNEKDGNCTAATSGNLYCSAGYRCFLYDVEEEQQPVADANGFCLPTALCDAAAAGLPGGGRCG